MPSRLSLPLVIGCVLATFVLWWHHDLLISEYAIMICDPPVQ